jgi:hypothetical protein
MSCERRNRRPPHLARDMLHRFGVGRRSDGEAGLDDVDAERVERPRERRLGEDVHGEAGRLLAVAQGRVENHYAGGIVSHTPL